MPTFIVIILWLLLDIQSIALTLPILDSTLIQMVRHRFEKEEEEEVAVPLWAHSHQLFRCQQLNCSLASFCLLCCCCFSCFRVFPRWINYMLICFAIFFFLFHFGILASSIFITCSDGVTLARRTQGRRYVQWSFGIDWFLDEYEFNRCHLYLSGRRQFLETIGRVYPWQCH